MLKWAQTKHKNNKQNSRVERFPQLFTEVLISSIKAIFAYKKNLVIKACSIYMHYMDKKSYNNLIFKNKTVKVQRKNSLKIVFY